MSEIVNWECDDLEYFTPPRDLASVPTERRLEMMMRFLVRQHDSFYENDAIELRGYVVVAGLDAGKENGRARLSVYRRRDVLNWFGEACRCYWQCRTDDPDFGWVDACFETMPEEANWTEDA